MRGRDDILSHCFRQIDAYVALWYASITWCHARDKVMSRHRRHAVVLRMTACCATMIVLSSGQLRLVLANLAVLRLIDVAQYVAHIGGLV